MNGRVVFSNEEPPPSLANATSSTATRPSIFEAGGSVRGVKNANRGSAPDRGETMAEKILDFPAQGARRPAPRACQPDSAPGR